MEEAWKNAILLATDHGWHYYRALDDTDVMFYVGPVDRMEDPVILREYKREMLAFEQILQEGGYTANMAYIEGQPYFTVAFLKPMEAVMFYRQFL